MELFSFGPWLMLCRCAFLNECLNSCRALALGDGDGRFTARLLRENHAIRIDAVDASSAMLRDLSLRAGPHIDRIRTCHSDVRSLQLPNSTYDLILTHFFLDCLSTEEVKSLAAGLDGAASPGFCGLFPNSPFLQTGSGCSSRDRSFGRSTASSAG
jgi:hypothetical protein